MKGENQKPIVCNSKVRRFLKRKHCSKRIPSNIQLNLISVSILPRGAGWSEMEGFVTRKYGPFVYYFRNEKDEIIAGIRFHVTYHCKGQSNGKGFYLAEATITPYKLYAHRGYELICNVTASDPMNYGTKADPIAGFVLKVQLQVRSKHPLKSNPLNSNPLNSNPLNTTPLNTTPLKTTPLNSTLIDTQQNQVILNQQSQNQQSQNQQSPDQQSKKQNKTIKSRLKSIQSPLVKRKNILIGVIPRKQIILPISHPQGMQSITTVQTSGYKENRINVEEQHLSVLIRGDCQVSLLSDYL